jgi:16S rRNA (cytosine967-C5)-methyltransferase
MSSPQERGRFRRHPGSKKKPGRGRRVEPVAPGAPPLSEPSVPASPQSFDVNPVTARQYAFVILNEARRTAQYIDELLERQPGIDELSVVDRRFLTELINGVTRRTRTLDSILSHYVTRRRDQVEPALWTLLRLGTYQLVLMTGVSSHAAVSETVELAAWLDQSQWKGFLNGVLRTISREVTDEFADAPARDCVPVVTRRDATGQMLDFEQTRFRRLASPVLPDPNQWTDFLAAAFGLPGWLLDRWTLRFTNDELQEIAEWFERRPPLTLRVNPLKGTRDELLKLLRESTAADANPDATGSRVFFTAGERAESIHVLGSVRVTELPGFDDGRFTIQDETAMSAVELLAPQPGQSVLDLCAAPGTKSTHIAELMQNSGSIMAADKDPERLRRVEGNVQRLGLDIIEPIHVSDDLSDLPITLFDAVLADVPCSNTGVIGKRPEVRTRLMPRDIEELARLQQNLLRNAAQRVRPGGRLVYSTCSIEQQENASVISSLLDLSTEFTLEEVREFIPGRPSDGGFQALLVRAE